MSEKTKWESLTKAPFRSGWYVTRTEDGYVSWRAFGNSAWWKQLAGGWIETFDVDGISMRYEWNAASRQPIDLNRDQLPEIPPELLASCTQRKARK